LIYKLADLMNQKFKIADWTVDSNQCLLVKGPQNLKLEPKAVALLVVLAEANDELVSR
jgi:DNA-binding winged helix-turn-helix (wHTH) protein